MMFDGALAQRSREVKKAIEMFERVTKLSPEFPEAYYNWGSLLLSQGKYKEAVSVLAKAVNDAPHSAIISTRSLSPSDTVANLCTSRRQKHTIEAAYRISPFSPCSISQNSSVSLASSSSHRCYS